MQSLLYCGAIAILLIQSTDSLSLNETDYDYEENLFEEETREEHGTGFTAKALVETKVLQKTVNENHKLKISNSVEYFIKFEVPEDLIEKYESEPEKHIFQVDARSEDATERYPVDITVRQFGRMIAFQLPSIEKSQSENQEHILYSRQERSIDLCPLDHIDSENSTVTISISTFSDKEVDVDIKVRIKGRGIDWIQTTDTNGISYTSHTSIHPASSKIRFFDTSLLQTDSIIIKVQTRDNSDCLCSIISIQQPKCPFHDDVGGAQRFGVWSTMLDQGTVIIHPYEYPDGFIIVLVASAQESVCRNPPICSFKNIKNGIKEPTKRVTITVGSNGSDSDYALATLTIIGLYILIFILTFILSFLFTFKYKYADFEYIVKQIEETVVDYSTQYSTVFRRTSNGKTISGGLKIAGEHIDQISEVIVGEIDVEPGQINGSESEITLRKKSENVGNNILNRQSIEFIDSSEAFDELTGIPSPKPIEGMLASVEEVKEDEEDNDDKIGNTSKQSRLKRHKTYLFVSDLSTKLKDPTKTKSVYQKSQLYLGVLFLISLFYSLPVLQMVFSFSYEQGVTGNQDICYYNDLCRKPLGLVRDFNHVFSNLGYCIFGILFMIIVCFKQIKYRKFLNKNESIMKDNYGVPTQYGLYYAMGLALFMEGVMSSCYHVCPTNITFQFDTTFMYLIAVLMFMKLYQVRHADVSANAVGVFFGLGVALFLETISIYYSGPIFWIFFSFVYFIVIVVVSVHAYNIGIVKYDYKILIVVTKILAREIKHLFVKETGSPRQTPHKAKPRLICLLIIAIINMVLCLYFGIKGTPGASNYLLAIFFLNLALYGSYYCTMKLINGEKIHFVPCIYALLGLICFLPSLYFFTKKEKQTELSPSESRNLNKECLFLNFFDGHDVWHFLGGTGVFFAFLFILTLDDDLKGKPRDKIHVF